MRRSFLILLLACAFSFQGKAWLYPEHRDITLRAIQRLDTGNRQMLERLWKMVRSGNESRLCPLAIDTAQGLSPYCLDYAAWPAISGDHSCSPVNLADVALHSDWIMKVAAVAAKLKLDLAKAHNNHEKDNAMRDADIRLLRADPDYTSRASLNNAHFKLALPDINTSAADYMAYCLHEGSPVNLTGIYLWFHSCALQRARMLRNSGLSTEERSRIVLEMLADEAFAVHFLEDCFASGHVAGIWGDASQRKGTHDYYNEAGYKVTTWDGERMVLMGDAYMTEKDIERTASSVRMSLEQLFDEMRGTGPGSSPDAGKGQAVPDTFDICRHVNMPASDLDPGLVAKCRDVMMKTPVPGLDSGPGAMPRTSTELGPFIGIVTAFRGSVLQHGFSTYQQTAGFVPGLEIALRIGLGLEGLLNESADGLMFLDAGWRLDLASSMKVATDSSLQNLGQVFSALPSRDALFLRLRLPFYLIPGDLLILAPVLYLTSPKTMNRVVATAGNGGLIPWQTRMITRAGSFQFVLGREVGVSFYGIGKEPDAYFMMNNPSGDVLICGMNSTQLHVPIFEYRMVRTYASRQSADLFLQLYGGIDFPGKRKALYPADAQLPPVGNIYFFGLRIAFDYRHYFGGK